MGVLSIIIPKPFILGLIIGTVGSLINTYIFELYLSRKSKPDNIHISTGNTWRYLVAIIACNMVLLKDYVNIIGVMIGLMFSYVLIILRLTAKELKF